MLGFLAVLYELLFLAPAVAAYAFLAMLYPVLTQDILRYGLFCVGFVVLPSYALSRLLLRSSVGFMERVCLGFPVSQGLLFLLAWGGSRMGLSWWGALALPSLGLYALWDLLGRRGGNKRTEPFVILLGTLTATVGLALCCLYFLRIPLPAEGVPAGFYYDDSLMGMGIFSALKAMLSGQPYMDGRYGDIPATYHLLLFTNNAVAHLVTGIHPYLLHLYIYPIMFWSTLAGGIAAGCRRLAGFGKPETLLAVCLLFFSSGLDFTAIPWLQMFMYFHTYFASLPAAALFGLLLFGVLSGRLERLPILYATMLFLTASAAKSVIMLLVPLGLVPVLLYRAATRKLCLDDLRFAAGLLASALLLRAIVYRSTSQLLIKKFNLLNSVMDLVVTGAELLPFALLLLLLARQDRLAGYKVGLHKQYLILVGGMFALSVALTRSIEFVGGGQYFFWFTRLYLLIGVAGCLGWAFQKRMRVVLTAALGVAAAAVLFFGLRMVEINKPPLTAPSLETTMDKGEWNGLMWAYANLDRSKRFICNRADFIEVRSGNPTHARYYDFLAVSGMYGYAWPFEWLPTDTARIISERLAKTQAFWEAETPLQQEQALREIPADYLFVSKRAKQLDYTVLSGILQVYTNPSLDIYDLRGIARHN